MSWKGFCIIAACGSALGGCSIVGEPVAAALAGAGTTSAISHSLNGTAYRTFTSTLPEVKAAALDTLAMMGIRVDSFETGEHGEKIFGTAYDRRIEVELEPISAKATRIGVATRSGLFYDSATSTEIVLQTEKALGVNEITNSSTGSSRRRSR